VRALQHEQAAPLFPILAKGTEQLASDDPVYEHLAREFQRTTASHRGPEQGDPHRDPPQFDVLRILRVKAPRLQEKYLAEVQDIAGLCQRAVTSLTVDALEVSSFDGLSMNEFLMYHGAPSDLVESRLLMQGLDPRYAGEHFGKLFGSGIYLATNSSKSDIYTKPNPAGERCILVVRACLGEAYLCSEPMRRSLRPPERPDGRGALSSVIALTTTGGGCVEHPEYIVYKESQTLVEYAIWYKHRPSCRCTHCIQLHEEQAAANRVYSARTYQHFLDAALVRFLKQKHAITAGVDVPYTSLAEMQQHVRDECNRLGFPIAADPAILRRIQDLVGRQYFEQQGLSLFRYIP